MHVHQAPRAFIHCMVGALRKKQTEEDTEPWPKDRRETDEDSRPEKRDAGKQKRQATLAYGWLRRVHYTTASNPRVDHPRSHLSKGGERERKRERDRERETRVGRMLVAGPQTSSVTLDLRELAVAR